jgi:DNA-binding NarL/FixJ family response regulator
MDDYKITARQRQVIHLIAAGLSNTEVARELGVSPRTAKAHSDILRRTLGVSRRTRVPLAYRVLTGRDPFLGPQALLVGNDRLTPARVARG